MGSLSKKQEYVTLHQHKFSKKINAQIK